MDRRPTSTVRRRPRTGSKIVADTSSGAPTYSTLFSGMQIARYKWANPQKRLPQGEKMKVTYKVCFPLKINEEGLHFDDEVKKVGNNMTNLNCQKINY